MAEADRAKHHTQQSQRCAQLCRFKVAPKDKALSFAVADVESIRDDGWEHSNSTNKDRIMADEVSQG